MRELLMVIWFGTIAGATLWAQDAEIYELQINENKFDVLLDKNYNVKLPSGEQIRVLVRKKDLNNYSDKQLSFRHPEDLTPVISEINKSLTQIQLASPLGNLLLIQKHSAYGGLNVSTLLEVVLRKVNQRELEHGYTLQKSDFSREIAGGKTLNGLKAIVFSDTDRGYECSVSAFGTGDSGIVVVTKIREEFKTRDQDFLDMFWESLRLAF